MREKVLEGPPHPLDVAYTKLGIGIYCVKPLIHVIRFNLSTESFKMIDAELSKFCGGLQTGLSETMGLFAFGSFIGIYNLVCIRFEFNFSKGNQNE